MIEKILLANSGTGNTEAMMKVLMEIPLIQRAEVTVLHVVPPQVTAEEMTNKWEAGGKTLAEAINTLSLDPKRVMAMLREGDPKDVVCKVAEETDASLVIMGSRGLRGLQAILENSVSQYVFQLASRPMLLVKDDLYTIRPIKRVLVALDKSDSAQQGLKLALSMLRDVKEGELILVHSVSNLKAKPLEETNPNPEKDPVLAAAIAEAKRFGIKYRCVAPEGKAGQRICQLAEDMNVNLLILGSPDRRPSIAKGLPDLDRLLGESLSDYVRVYAPCPVLLTRMSA
ncbi:MAG: universal stress protein [Leptolyngbyaceae cyanobacterium SM1_1_3]|nr:universal stress protein [Leptolyngbyaceae cyanobacterium SM1_1_3]NJM85654.1 universal stress protein [Leptolyngbyaceae cyanobacterium RM2_2_21]NJN04558.1 universal stress protein [Leptolyngbyaceae cyanobacterium RM1_1_2]NJO10951.1 universal stress protein [Leptolyngbyaceae cyanobacterium SL_1_1]